MVTKRLLSIFIVLSISLTLFAQKDFKPGYLITNLQDTIYGQISLSSSSSNNRKCVFLSEGEAETIYSPFEIYGYRIDDLKFYVSKEIEINDKKEKVFLEYLVNGIVNLYYFNELSIDYYFIEKDNELHPLTNNEIVTANEFGDEYARNSNQYIGALAYYFKDSPELKAEIGATKFTHKSIISITKDYHNSVCSEYECVEYVKETKRSLVIEPSIGIAFSRLSFRGSDGIATDLAPTFGIDFTIKSTQSHYSIDLSIGLSLKKDEFEGNFAVPNIRGRKEDYRVNIEQTVLKIPLQGTYSFNVNKFQPILMGAFVNGFMLNPTYEARGLSILYDGTEIVHSLVDNKPITYHFGFMIGTGVRYYLKNERFVQLSMKYDYLTAASASGYFFEPMRVGSFGVSISYSLLVN